MPTEAQVPGIVAEVRQRLDEAAKQGVHMQVVSEKLDDGWLYVVVTPSQPGQRASDHGASCRESSGKCGRREPTISCWCPRLRIECGLVPRRHQDRATASPLRDLGCSAPPSGAYRAKRISILAQRHCPDRRLGPGRDILRVGSRPARHARSPTLVGFETGAFCLLRRKGYSTRSSV